MQQKSGGIHNEAQGIAAEMPPAAPAIGNEPEDRLPD